MLVAVCHAKRCPTADTFQSLPFLQAECAANAKQSDLFDFSQTSTSSGEINFSLGALWTQKKIRPCGAKILKKVKSAVGAIKKMKSCDYGGEGGVPEPINDPSSEVNDPRLNPPPAFSTS